MSGRSRVPRKVRLTLLISHGNERCQHHDLLDQEPSTVDYCYFRFLTTDLQICHVESSGLVFPNGLP